MPAREDQSPWASQQQQNKDEMSNQYNQLSNEQKERFEEKVDKTKRITSLALVVIGVALMCVAFIEPLHGGSMFYVALLVGLVLAVYGGVKAAFGCTMLTDSKTGSKVEMRNIYFQSSDKGEVMNAINNGKWSNLNKGSQSTTTLPICLRTWFTSNGQYASTLLLEYVPYEYVPVTKIQEIPDDARNSFINFVKNSK